MADEPEEDPPEEPDAAAAAALRESLERAHELVVEAKHVMRQLSEGSDPAGSTARD